MTAATAIRDTPVWVALSSTSHAIGYVQVGPWRTRVLEAGPADGEPLIPAEDPDYEPLSLAFPAWTDPARAAILQPPPPQIQPSPQILEHITDRDLDMEAGG